MPVLKHAKKKLRQDHKRTIDNLRIKKNYKKLVKEARSARTAEALNAAFSAIDKAAKKMVLHHNKAARLKSSLTKALSSEAPKAVVAKSTKKKAVKKATKSKKK